MADEILYSLIVTGPEVQAMKGLLAAPEAPIKLLSTTKVKRASDCSAFSLRQHQHHAFAHRAADLTEEAQGQSRKAPFAAEGVSVEAIHRSPHPIVGLIAVHDL